MVPNIVDIVRYRYIARMALQVVGVLFMLFGFVPLIWWLGEGLRDDDLFWMGYYGMRVTLGVFFMVAGGLFLGTAPWIARLLTPVPKPRCPKCRYTLMRHTERCPECGLPIPAELRPAEDPHATVPTLPDSKP